MLSLHNPTHWFLRTSSTSQVIDGEPQDVEKDIVKSAESRGTANNRLIRLPDLSSGFKTRGHGLKHPFLKGLLNLNSNQSPTYRSLPIISGVLIPFSILLSIPSLTVHWYIRTDANSMILESRPNTLLLDLGMGFSMACGVLACVCLVVRFSERNVLRMTQLCILFLTLHDLINISAITIFGVQHRFDDGFTYGQSFWFTVCSTIASTATNITLVVDYFQTKDFVNNGSGLTPKQRSLVIIIIILLCYLALGSLLQTFMLKISFIDALYFSVVSIETIGFGDLHPISTGTRIFACFYIAVGILNLALAVALLREVLLEGLALGFQARVKVIRTRQRERRIRTRWRTAVKLRLRANNLPMWVVDNDGETDEQDWRHHHYHPWWRSANQVWHFFRKRLSHEPVKRRVRKRKHLNLQALTEAEMEDAALAAGAPLVDLLPPGLKSASLTAAGDDMEGEDDEEPISDRGRVPFIQSMTMHDEACLEDTLVAEEKIAFVARLTVALLAFFVFWMAGSVIFMKTEGWGFGAAVYFCFMSFTTVGYGDLAPRTPAGRSIFVAWALVGVATMTILISILVEAYSSQFKSVIRTDMLSPGLTSTDDGTGTHQPRFLRSSGIHTKDNLMSPTSPTMTSSSSKMRHYDWEPNMPSIPEGSGSQKHKIKEGLESLHEILRHAQTLRSLVAPEIWSEDATSAESNPADSGTPQITPLSDVRCPRRKICQIDETVQEIINAAQSALEVIDVGNASTMTSHQNYPSIQVAAAPIAVLYH